MSIDLNHKSLPLPDYLFVVTANDYQVYYFDTQWSRTSAYLDFIRRTNTDKTFYVHREDDPEKIEALW